MNNIKNFSNMIITNNCNIIINSYYAYNSQCYIVNINYQNVKGEEQRRSNKRLVQSKIFQSCSSMFGCLRTVVESWHLQCLLSHFYTASSSRYSTHALGLASLNHLAFLGIYSMALEFPEFYGLHYNIIYNIGFIFSFLKWPLRNSLQNPNMATHFLA